MTLGYTLSETELYSGVSLTFGFYFYYIFGWTVTGLIFTVFLIKSLIIRDLKNDKGSIIPHILAMKCGALALFPTYSEYVNYCWGFMLADFPWMNSTIGEILAEPTDSIPSPFAVFFTNLNLGSTYSLAMLVVVVLIAVPWIFSIWLDWL